MLANLDDAASIVTGGASGNGRAIALKLAEAGSNVTIADIREEPRESGQPTHELIETEYDANARFVETDVTSIDDLQATVQETVDAYGSLDVMVNNAGIFEGGSIYDIEEDEFDRTIDINVRGVFFGCKAAAEVMREQDEKNAIVNLSSVGGLSGLDQASTYCTSKGAVANLTRELAVELGPDNIRVNAINPGLVETQMLADAGIDEEHSQYLPLGELCTPEEIGNTAVYLASDMSSHVTGHNLVVDGGLLANGYW
ncbi:SDR family oxidoreductase [Natrinema salinisoli]|uniref:SDR family oxidoreductase n=1 Tax=Natrinema salinisoli TaxID=2878535 RepID=UPI001CF06BB4|nr:SDR family oxidoreductase [Natrinema salinisoli]